MLPGAPVPKGADAVVQIENTEQLPQQQDGEKRINIVKVLFIADVFYTSADWGGFQIARCIQLVASLLNMQRTAVKTRLARIETWTLIMRVLTSHGFLSDSIMRCQPAICPSLLNVMHHNVTTRFVPSSLLFFSIWLFTRADRPCAHLWFCGVVCKLTASSKYAMGI